MPACISLLYIDNISDRRERVSCTSYRTSFVFFIPVSLIYQLFRCHAKRVCLGQMNHEVIELPPHDPQDVRQLANGVRIALPSKHSRQHFSHILGSQFSMKMHLFTLQYYVFICIFTDFCCFLAKTSHFFSFLQHGDRREPVQPCATPILCVIIPGWGGV